MPGETVAACSFCGSTAADVEMLFENEEKTAAICAACVATFHEASAENES